MKNLLTLLLSTVCTLQLVAQKPSWADFDRRASAYPTSMYYVGYGSMPYEKGNKPADIEEQAKRYARTSLIESIQVNIKSVSEQFSSMRGDEVSRSFDQLSVSVSSAEIAGLKEELINDDRNQTVYALAYARIDEVKTYYQNKVDQGFLTIENEIAMASQELQAGDRQQALKRYFKCQQEFTEVEEAATYLTMISGNFEETTLTKLNTLKLDVKKGINDIKTNQQFSIEDAAFYIANGLKIQQETLDKPVTIKNFSYQDTPMGSMFSRRLSTALETQLVKEAGYDVKSTTANTASAGESDIYILTGTYWDEGDQLMVKSILRELQTGKSVATMEAYIPVSALTTRNISFKPENYGQALTNLEMLSENDIVNSDLRVDVFTNKGRSNLIFMENERMKLYVKANRECYLRFIYHLADGSKVLLMDDYYISRDMANKAVELPDEFICSEPFGAELLVLNAQTSKFEPLDTFDQYGYRFIEEPMESIIGKTRGFKKVVTQEEREMKAETRLVITTTPAYQ